MKTRWPIYVASLLLLVASAVSGWDWWECHDAETLAWLQRVPGAARAVDRAVGADRRAPEITFAVDASYPPFAYIDSTGKLVGFEVDLATELGRRVADEVRLVNMDAGDTLFDALASRKIDGIIAGLTYRPEAIREVAYSDGYFEAGSVILARTDRGDLRGAGDLREKRVAVEVGSLADEAAQKLQRLQPGMELVAMGDLDRVLEAVAHGAVDAAVVDKAYLPAGLPSTGSLHQVGSALRPEPYLVAVRRGDRGLLVAIYRELAAMRSRGVLAEMERAWFFGGSGSQERK